MWTTWPFLCRIACIGMEQLNILACSKERPLLLQQLSLDAWSCNSRLPTHLPCSIQTLPWSKVFRCSVARYLLWSNVNRLPLCVSFDEGQLLAKFGLSMPQQRLLSTLQWLKAKKLDESKRTGICGNCLFLEMIYHQVSPRACELFWNLPCTHQVSPSVRELFKSLLQAHQVSPSVLELFLWSLPRGHQVTPCITKCFRAI